MMAPKLRFSRGLRESARHCLWCSPGPLRRRSSKFLQARRPRLAQEATMGKVTIFFFFLPSRVFQVYGCYFTNVLTQRSCLGFHLTTDSQCFTRNDARTFVPTIPRRRLWLGERSRWVETSRYSFTAEVWSFSPQAPPSLVSSSSKYPPSFVALAFNKTKPAESLLDRRRNESHQTYSSYQLVASGNSHNAVSRHLDKTARSIEELFLNEKGPEEQAAINELTKKTPRRHATTTTPVAGLWQMRRNEIEVGRIYTSLATGMVVLATYIYVPWQWTG